MQTENTRIAELEATVARLKQQIETPVTFSVSLGRMIAGGETTYHVILMSSLRPADADLMDDTGLIVPYTTDNYDHAVLEANDWAEFLCATSVSINISEG